MSRLTATRLVLRGLAHHRVAGLLVAFGIAVATACVTGSLLIGRSMEGSLRDLALQRLGRTTDAFDSPFFHRDQLAQTLESTGAHVARIVREQGVSERSSTGVVVPKVHITGVDPSFWSFFTDTPPVDLQGRRAAVSRALARDLGLRDTPGPVDPPEDVIITLAREGGARAGTLFAHQSAEKTQRKLRLEIAQVLPDEAGGVFALRGGASTHPRNLFVAREWLARTIGQSARFNALLIERTAASDSDELLHQLNAASQLDDFGLRLIANTEHAYVSLESSEVVLPARQLESIDRLTAQQRLNAAHTSIYLANTITALEGGKGESAYALLAATQPLTPLPFRKGGGTEPGPDGIWLNEWLAQDLQADVGTRVRVVFPMPSPDGAQQTQTRELTVRGIVELRGAGADPGLTPSVEGITEAKSIDSWSLPFPIDKSRIQARDEDYWEKYRTTPKAFVSLDLLKQLWSPPKALGLAGRPTDWVTSVRITVPADRTAEAFVSALKTQLCAQLSLRDTGASLRPVKDEALAGAHGNTDFGQLFMGLSFFIILAAVGLAASLMRLQAQRRSGEAGLLLASGFSVGRVVRLMLLEGAGWSILGAVLGVIAGQVYATFLIRALNSFWSGAVAGTTLSLHPDAGALIGGGVFGLVAGLGAAWWGARCVTRKPAVDLLTGWRAGLVRTENAGAGRSLWIGVTSALVGVLLLVTAMTSSAIGSTAAFFGAGGALLVAALLLLHALLQRAWRRPLRPLTTLGLAFRSAALFRGRSVLVVGLLSAACFVLVAVASQRRDPRRLDVTRRDSGAGGFVLRVDTALPLRYDLGTAEGRRRVGLTEDEESLFDEAEIVSLLASPGDEISCLNLARPAQPRLLGVSEKMIARGGFRLVSTDDQGWNALNAEGTPEIPVFGDAASVQWTLHSGLGQSYVLQHGSGESNVRFAGVLPGSIFAGELLMRDESFRELYPQVEAPTCFLVAMPLEREAAAAEVLRRRLAPYGAQVRSTREILAEFLSVQNTYLSVFLALGGLGLLLSTVGLVAVLVRNVHERRSELALLQASGFNPLRLAGLVNCEYVGLLVAGLAVGTCSALIAVVPSMRATDAEINYMALTGLLAGILVFGVLICAAASVLVSRGPLLDALRQE